ncbi:MAG: creatininase family protein [Thermoanaerobaculia bacterium]|nr:creatininase family protein [Thermoanaerobaculia bacterium]
MSARRHELLDQLLVVDRLEIGPVRLEAERMTAPYTVVVGDARESTDLAYKFEQPVFDPEELASRNLAAMAAAQVALNYGLFAREIVFHGPLDRFDRRFLAEMAENTAREIYVNKLLKENPLLVEPPDLPEEGVDRYLQAELSFPEAVDERIALAPPPEAAGEGAPRCGVLASGGKDSLLTLGLLEEMGHEAHSLFVNESGRHWYTALNAHRHLRDSRPDRTARVWTSSDRVFSWMLRHLPFVRPDFASVRSDNYPIRLWTVAVFLFGVLPVARARGLDRILPGDEFDTTVRVHRGTIPHYDGLYDQSRWFDERLTRWYRAKSWPLVQFSLLRQCSEMLIQKTLAERYPELHALQVSCHATHIEEERVRPCGRCEKCRRIVAMHLALGLDPTHCGYEAEQIERAVAELGDKPLHQERVALEHLAWLLAERDVAPSGLAEVEAHRRPEVMSLRFHGEASPIEGLPRDLRRPLFEILLEQAEGALARSGRSWQPYDPLAPAELTRPYRHERASPQPAGRDSVAGEYLLGELSWPRARTRLRETDTALLPVGATEQHGPHLPLDTDSWDADYLCRRVAERCSRPRPLVLPLVPYGVSYHHDDFAGTLSISPETLAQLVYEIGMAVARQGISKLVIVNGHGGNAPTLALAAQRINRDANIFTCVDTGETSDRDVEELVDTPNDAHAGEIETSTTLATRPHLVDLDRAPRDGLRFSSEYLEFSSDYAVPWFAETHKLSASGVLGDPTRATAEKGQLIWGVMIDHLVRFVEQIKGMSLDEIHERRL